MGVFHKIIPDDIVFHLGKSETVKRYSGSTVIDVISFDNSVNPALNTYAMGIGCPHPDPDIMDGIPRKNIVAGVFCLFS